MGLENILQYAVHGPDGLVPKAEPEFKPGEKAKHERGVTYQASWTTAMDGFNEHARRCARVLADTGCPVLLKAHQPKFLESVEENALAEQYKDLVHASFATTTAQVCQAVLRGGMLPTLIRHPHLTPEQNAANNKRKVISSVFERDRVSPDMVRQFNQVGQVWVACEANKTMLEKAGVELSKLRVVPIPYMPDDPHLKLRGRTRAPGPVRFYHIGKWEPRKAQDQIFEAFLRAFKPGDATLIMKTSPRSPEFVNYPETMSVVIELLKKSASVQANGWTTENVKKHIFVMAQYIPARQLVSLHQAGDVYVTLSRAEGFDMPAFDAKLAGNLMVYTPSGGPQDFAGPEDVLVKPHGMMKCNPFYRFEPDALWLYFKIEEAVAALRVAREKVLAGQRSTANLDRFQASVVGPLMLKNLQELTAPDKVF